MIRRDYILRMIEEFIRALAKINNKKQQHLWREADSTIDDEARRLTGSDLATIATLTDTELLSRLLETGEFQAQREKTFMLARLLIEGAEVAEAEHREIESRNLRLKALHLLLDAVLRSDVFEWPEFVPNIDLLLQRLDTATLPPHTHALLMQHFERSGQFARAEDSLFAMLDLAPDNPTLCQLGISFYHRLLTQTDAALEAGGLPRAEAESALDQLRARTK